MATSPPNVSGILYEDVFIARQPIFDAERALWGYELLYRHSLHARSAEFRDMDAATLTVTANACLWPFRGLGDNAKLLIHFPAHSILARIPCALPPERTIIQVQESLSPEDAVLDALLALKNAGYRLALDDYSGRVQVWEALADIAMVDVLAVEQRAWPDLAGKILSRGKIPMAKKIETNTVFHTALDCDFKLFQGFFFKQPEMHADRRLAPTQVSRLTLFSMLDDPEPDFDHLAEELKRDVAVSYRMFRYLNSPFFGFQREISSVQEAVVLLGWLKLKTWLRVVILTEMAPPGKCPELAKLSVQRGRFLELMAEEQAGIGPESLFLLGLFSLLGVMLDMPMATVVETLPLPQELKAALCGQGEVYGDWLALVLAFEEGRWRELDVLIESLCLDPMAVARRYIEAENWTAAFFH